MIAPASAFTIEQVSWVAASDALQAVRRTVFIDEQGVPEHLEWDADDPQSLHVLARGPGGAPIGTGRLKPDCYAGRMAVLKAWRGRGVGGSILTTLLGMADTQGCSVVRLHAQTHAINFYARYGFIAVGAQFDEAGMPHLAMELTLFTSLR